MQDLIVVTGGAGFIGSNFILQRMRDESASIVNFDKLTYAGNPHNLNSIADNPRYHFVQGDIIDRELVRKTLARHQPRAIVHFAAESHVDRSIRGPEDFIHTNVNGTFALLEEVRAYWSSLGEPLLVDRVRLGCVDVNVAVVIRRFGFAHADGLVPAVHP